MITIGHFPRMGNLGNQLFQLAAAYALAKRLKTKVAVKEWPNDYLFPKVWDYLYKGTAPAKQTYNDKLNLSFAELPLIDGLQITGYFQSEKFFQDCRADIRDMFTFNYTPEPKAENIIALNIRGGDFKKYRATYKEIDANYYKEAIERSGCDTVHVYTDDGLYAMQLLKTLKLPNVRYFRPNKDTNLPEMTLYKHLALSNSTYSWWAGELNQTPDAVIYAPAKWFNTHTLTERDLISSRFTVINNG